MTTKKLLVVVLVLCMVLTATLTGCGKSQDNDTLVVGYSYFNAKFSPFFAETAYDQDVASMTAVSLLPYDRLGQVVTKGIEGEKRNYNGTDYTYKGLADVDITENADGTVYYDFKIRDDVKFSDGEPLTIDDVIFSMYVFADPAYDGSTTLYSLPIKGMEEYRAGMQTMYNMMMDAGMSNEDFTYWTKEEQDAFWADVNAGGPDFAKSICDYCVNNYLSSYYSLVADSPDAIMNDPKLRVAFGEVLWGYSGEGETYEDYWKEMVEAYEGDLCTLVNTEVADLAISNFMKEYNSKWAKALKTGESAPSITGIEKTGDYSMRVTFTEIDATWYVTLPVVVCPLHYYGDESKYDYANNKFGFDKGDLSVVKSKTTTPLGAGPYKFVSYENGTVRFEANETYYMGAPKIKYINFLESTDAEKVNGIVTGTIDITDPSISEDVEKTIRSTNSNGELTGNKIATDLVNNLGYGYIGMNALNMAIGDPDSDASKNLRKAFGTVFSAYRELAVSSYYGEKANVINYPISDTSWAAPQASDEGYEIAFSKDVNGNDIYTSGMTADEKYAAAAKAALGYLEAAGFKVVDGKVTEAPKGGTLTYTAWIPGDGIGDHPTFMVFSEAEKIFDSLGLDFIVKDLSNSDDLWDALDANQVQIWAAAWGATVDPDMYQIYYSDIANHAKYEKKSKTNPLGGPEQGGSNYEYCIADPELDKLIIQGRKVADLSARKAIYKAALDIVIDWAVEVPVYQRQNCIIFNPNTVNMDTVTPDITTFYGWMSEIENTELLK